MKNFLKKSLVITAMLFSVLSIASLSTTTSAFATEGAADNSSSSSSSSSNSSDPSLTGCRYFLGMKSWDCGIIKEPLNDHDLESNVQKIATNVADNIVTIAAYLIVGYVIYGGYLYILASGDAGKVAAGKKTLIHAFIGLAIIGLTKAIISSIQTVFGIKAFEACSALEQTGCGVTPEELVLNSIQWFIGVAGVVAVAFIVLGGIKYITSSGDAGKLQQAKNTILHALIGLVIVGLAFAISNFFINVVNKASTEAGIEYSVINILNSFIVIAGIVAVVFIIIGGVGYMTSAGDAGKIKKAKDTILYSVIGLIVVALAFAIVNFAIKAINNDTSEENAYLLQETSLPEKGSPPKQVAQHSSC